MKTRLLKHLIRNYSRIQSTYPSPDTSFKSFKNFPMDWVDQNLEPVCEHSPCDVVLGVFTASAFLLEHVERVLPSQLYAQPPCFSTLPYNMQRNLFEGVHQWN